jgi:hypothetical protein
MRFICYSILLFAFLFSCTSSKDDKKELIEISDELKPVFTCNEKVVAVQGSEDSSFIKKCNYKHFQFVSIAEADYKGRYSYTYELYQKNSKGKFSKIKNSAFFNSKIDELEEKLNKLIAFDYNNAANSEDSENCFEGFELQKYSIDDVGITVSGDDINFNVIYGLSPACMSMNGTVISFKIFELEKYLK